MPVGDAATAWIVRADFDLHAVAGEDADPVLPHAAADGREHGETVVALDTEHGVRECFLDGPIELQLVVLRSLGGSLSAHWDRVYEPHRCVGYFESSCRSGMTWRAQASSWLPVYGLALWLDNSVIRRRCSVVLAHEEKGAHGVWRATRLVLAEGEPARGKPRDELLTVRGLVAVEQDGLRFADVRVVFEDLDFAARRADFQYVGHRQVACLHGPDGDARRLLVPEVVDGVICRADPGLEQRRRRSPLRADDSHRVQRDFPDGGLHRVREEGRDALRVGLVRVNGAAHVALREPDRGRSYVGTDVEDDGRRLEFESRSLVATVE